MLINNNEYLELIQSIKSEIQTAQYLQQKNIHI